MENNLEDVGIGSIGCFFLAFNLLTLDIIGTFEEIIRLSKTFKMPFMHFQKCLQENKQLLGNLEFCSKLLFFFGGILLMQHFVNLIKCYF